MGSRMKLGDKRDLGKGKVKKCCIFKTGLRPPSSTDCQETSNSSTVRVYMLYVSYNIIA